MRVHQLQISNNIFKVEAETKKLFFQHQRDYQSEDLVNVNDKDVQHHQLQGK